MGRFYSGNIYGKFWVAVQSSYDPSYFGGIINDIFNFYACGCNCEFDDIKNPNIYCTNCYDSYDDHIQTIKDEDIEQYDGNNIKTWFKSDNEIEYLFDNNQIDIINDKIKLLENIVGEHMHSYKIIDDGVVITYDYDVPKITDPILLENIARLCLGKQIIYCIQKHGFCNFCAEI